MAAEVRLSLTQKSALLTFVVGDRIVDREEWVFPTLAPRREIRDIAECVFHDSYDLMNHSVHGAIE